MGYLILGINLQVFVQFFKKIHWTKKPKIIFKLGEVAELVSTTFYEDFVLCVFLFNENNTLKFIGRVILG